MIFLLVFAYFIINFIIANAMQNVAFTKGYDSSAHAFAFSFWLGVAGWFYVIALPDLVSRKNQELILNELQNNHNTISMDELPEI